MEQKSLLLSAVSIGVGVGVGLGLASGQSASRWGASGSSMAGFSGEEIFQELMKLVIDGKQSNITFDEFPYFLSERTRMLLTSAAFVHLKNSDISKHTRNLSPASSTILLSGPAEPYQQMLAKALAQFFEAKLLLLDIPDFLLKMQHKYGVGRKENAFKRSISEKALELMSNLVGFFSTLSSKEEAKGMQQSSTSLFFKKHLYWASHKRSSSWCFDEKLFLQSLHKALVSMSETGSVILYLRDVDRLLLQSQRFYNLFEKMLKKLPSSMVILGSRMLEQGDHSRDVDERLGMLFPYNIEIKAPEEENHPVNWKALLEEDMKTLKYQDNKNHIAMVLAENDLECDDLGSICHADTVVLSNFIKQIVVSAIYYHLMNNKDPEYRNGKLVISSQSLSHVLNIFQDGKSSGKVTLKPEANADSSKEIGGGEPVTAETESESENPASESKTQIDENAPSAKVVNQILKCLTTLDYFTSFSYLGHDVPQEVPSDNKFEKRIRPEVIPANEIGVTFADIGACDEIKRSLQELVVLPLQWPDLFKGGLLKPCKGILLFGPPGTGKTMLAKAIANEAGASFINVSMSTITSKRFGEDEKNVRALFTLAAKVSPTIIFVDEVDSMLGQRTRDGEHEAMRTIKNEFMTHWDGLLTKAGERILVLAATNRPFDLDEAIIRRFERRIMVGLPSVESREMILRTVLSKEKVEDLDFKELAVMTEGYTGSDLKNLCVTAAYRPVRELIQKERMKDMERKKREAAGKSSEDASDSKEEGKEENKEERVIELRPLNMEDLRQAKNQVAASFATEGAVMSELKQWNELYGEGGSRKKQQLTYFL